MDYTDIRNGLVAAIAVNVEEPIFESQTKTKLGSTNMVPGGVTVNKYVGDFIKQEVDNFLHKHADVAEAIQQKIQESEKERKAIAGHQVAVQIFLRRQLKIGRMYRKIIKTDFFNRLAVTRHRNFFMQLMILEEDFNSDTVLRAVVPIRETTVIPFKDPVNINSRLIKR